MATIADQDTASQRISSSTVHDFHAMFPSKSLAQIESVLQKHHGDYANTIDELLASDQETIDSAAARAYFASGLSSFAASSSGFHHPHSSDQMLLTSPVFGIPPPPPYSEAIRASTSSQINVSGRGLDRFISSSNRLSYAPTPTTISARRHYSVDSSDSGFLSSRTRSNRMSLEEFKREKRRLDAFKRENERKLENVTNEAEARMLEDEQIALLMQDQELNRCMGITPPAHQRRSLSSYRTDFSTNPKPSRRAISPGPMIPQGPIVDGMLIHSNEKDFKEKLKIIGKASKARISQIASKFRKDE